jgi:isoquinoline 1-oxidoreductase beta subunit
VNGGRLRHGTEPFTDERDQLREGRVRQSNFHDYELLRHHASPRVICTHLVNDDYDLPPDGVGEPPVPPVTPALCNAVFASTGKRMRSRPVRRAA